MAASMEDPIDSTATVESDFTSVDDMAASMEDPISDAGGVAVPDEPEVDEKAEEMRREESTPFEPFNCTNDCCNADNTFKIEFEKYQYEGICHANCNEHCEK